jgi:hypothetical protein
MRKFGLLATAALLAVVLLASGVGTAGAEPQKNPELRKNQIEVPVTCDNDQSYTIVINGMSKVGQISGGNQNLVVTEFDVTFRDEDGDVVGRDTFDRGNAENPNPKGNSPQGDAISCDGSVETTLQGLGDVTAEFDFRGFVTPREQ